MRSIALWVNCLLRCDYGDWTVERWKTKSINCLSLHACMSVNWAELALTQQASTKAYLQGTENDHLCVNTHKTMQGRHTESAVLVLFNYFCFKFRRFSGNRTLTLSQWRSPIEKWWEINTSKTNEFPPLVLCIEVLRKHQEGNELLVFPWQPALLWKGHMIP